MLDLILDAWQGLWYPDGERRWVRRLVGIGVVCSVVATAIIVAGQL